MATGASASEVGLNLELGSLRSAATAAFTAQSIGRSLLLASAFNRTVVVPLKQCVIKTKGVTVAHSCQPAAFAYPGLALLHAMYVHDG